jgi:RNA polymerase sigma-70 factor (ECF subfamily)
VILARTGEAQAVDEVFQQVAVAALGPRAAQVAADRFGPWLHRVAVICSARYRRSRGRQRKAMRAVALREQSLGNGYAADVMSLLLDRERHEQTRAALARIPGADAEMLMLKYGEGWSYRRIAEQLGITEKAVDCRLTRARTRLRQILMSMGVEG